MGFDDNVEETQGRLEKREASNTEDEVNNMSTTVNT